MPVVGYNQLNELKFTEIRFNTHIHKPPHTRLQKNHKYLRTHIYRGISDVCVCVLVYFTYAPNFHLIHTSMLFFFYCLWTIIHLFAFFCCPNRRRGRGRIHAKENQKAPNNTRTIGREVLPSAFDRVVLPSAFVSYCHFTFD